MKIQSIGSRALRGIGYLLAGLMPLLGCGGSGATGGGGASPPSAPTGLAVNAGDGAVSLAWTAPVSNGGAAVSGYVVNLTPSTDHASVTVSGTAAVVRGLTNGASYTLSVAAMNPVGQGPASAPVQTAPVATDMNRYYRISVPSDPNAPTGIFDPSLVHAPSSTTWLAYSSANYYVDGSNHLVQDVSTSIATSQDGGQTFAYVQTVGAAEGPVTVTDTTHSVCGQPTCTGRWIYEVPFMLEDSSDPDPSRRYKLFAHKYFLYPPATPPNEYILGAIVMWTASSPDGTWSAESPVLGWNDTPPEIPPATNVNTLDPNLASCLLLTEGTASVTPSALDLAFSCPYPSGGSNVTKIVMLRSVDHSATFKYVSTLLTPADAPIFSGAAFFNAPAMIPSATMAPLLMVTPDNGAGLYLGCLAIPFASEQAGTLVRDASNLPVSIATIPTLGGHFGGACSWDQGVTATGILIDDYDPASSPPFGIVATTRSF